MDHRLYCTAASDDHFLCSRRWSRRNDHEQYTGDFRAGPSKGSPAGSLAGDTLYGDLSGTGISAGIDFTKIKHWQAGNDGYHRDPAYVGEFYIADHGMAAFAVAKRPDQRSPGGKIGRAHV